MTQQAKPKHERAYPINQPPFFPLQCPGCLKPIYEEDVERAIEDNWHVRNGLLPGERWWHSYCLKFARGEIGRRGFFDYDHFGGDFAS